MIRYVVTGCGQSGTMFAARLLSAAGLDCSHETVFSGWGPDYETAPDWRGSGRLGDSSFSAVPFLGELGGDVVVVHQVRAPLDQIGAVAGQGLLDQSPVPPWVRFVDHHVGILDVAPGLRRAAAYWLRWNDAVGSAADIRWGLQSIGDPTAGASLIHKLSDRVGVSVDRSRVLAAVQAVPGNVNSRAHKRRPVLLDDLGGLADEVRVAAARWQVPLSVFGDGYGNR